MSGPCYEQDHQGESLASLQLEFSRSLDSNKGGDINGREEDGGLGAVMAAPIRLTDDLIHTVFSFLDQRSLCSAAMVCRQWQTVSGHEDFWKSLSFQGAKVTQEKVGQLCRRYPRAVDLNFSGVPSVVEVARVAMHSLEGLTRLNLCKGLLNESFFDALATSCLVLQHMIIADVILGSGHRRGALRGRESIQVHHGTLQRLQIIRCQVMSIAISCPLLEELSLRRTSMFAAELHCPSLGSLDVSSCHKFSDVGVRAAATSCPSLTTLDISQCSYVSDETMREISVACSNLCKLDASYCPNIHLEHVSMQMLRELRLHDCDGINSSSMAALSQCLMLEIIQLDFCALLTDVVLDLDRLKNISLVHCRKFVNLTLHCLDLNKIHIARCPLLTRVDISSLALKKLVLQKQQSLATMTLRCPHLRVVDLTECDSLNDSVCEVFSDGGGCPSLSSLILDTCESLTMVNLSSTSIEQLSFAGCRKIYSINLACPNLWQLCLNGCGQLSTATFAPVGLLSLNLGICPRLIDVKIEATCMKSLELKGCGVLCRASICCTELLSLDASYCSQLEDEFLEATTTACPLMQSLILASCPIGPAGLLAMNNLCNLTTLDLSYTFLTDLIPIFENCPRLKILRLPACKFLVDCALDSLHEKKALPELRELDLSYGSLCHAALQRLLSQCCHLTHVSLNGCVNLSDLDWEVKQTPQFSLVKQDLISSIEEAPLLQSQNDKFASTKVGEKNPVIEYNFEHDTSVHVKNTCSFFKVTDEYADGSFKLEDADVIKIGSTVLGQKVIVPHALQHLNCVGCPNVKRVVIPDSAGFHALFSLNLSLANNIKEVRLECSYLTSLNLSNCTALENLNLKCPRLVDLSIQATNIEGTTLEGALQGCSALETLDIRNCSKMSLESLARMHAACPRLKQILNTISA